MPPKQKSKRDLWRRNSTSTAGSNFEKCRLSGTFLCMILQNFKKICQRPAELYAILLFFIAYLSLSLHCQRHNETVPSCTPSIVCILCILCSLIGGTVPSSRTRGRPKTACIDNTTLWTDLPLHQSLQDTKDRVPYRDQPSESIFFPAVGFRTH